MTSIILQYACIVTVAHHVHGTESIFRSERLNETALHVCAVDKTNHQIFQGFIFPSYTTRHSVNGVNSQVYACVMIDDHELNIPILKPSFINVLFFLTGQDHTSSIDNERLYRCGLKAGNTKSVQYEASNGLLYDVLFFNQTVWSKSFEKVTEDKNKSESGFFSVFAKNSFSYAIEIGKKARSIVQGSPGSNMSANLDDFLVTEETLCHIARINEESQGSTREISCINQQKDIFGEIESLPLCEPYGISFFPIDNHWHGEEDPDSSRIKMLTSYPMEFLDTGDATSITPRTFLRYLLSFSNDIDLKLPRSFESLLRFSSRTESPTIYTEGWCIPNVFNNSFVMPDARSGADPESKRILYGLLSQRSPCLLNQKMLEGLIDENILPCIRFPASSTERGLMSLLEFLPRPDSITRVLSSIQALQNFFIALLLLYLLIAHPIISICLLSIALFCVYTHIRSIIRAIL